MRIYAAKQENRAKCAGCGRVYLNVVTGLVENEGASGCPHCALHQRNGQKKAGKGSKKKCVKKE